MIGNLKKKKLSNVNLLIFLNLRIRTFFSFTLLQFYCHTLIFLQLIFHLNNIKISLFPFLSTKILQKSHKIVTTQQ